MSRAARLLDLIQVLRRHRRPVSGRALADEVGVSLRTLYRDIATLQAQGAAIEGEAGLGYVLMPGFMLPPLMFSEIEVDAIILGMRFVSQRGDEDLSAAAENVVAKIEAVLPPDLEKAALTNPLLVGPASTSRESGVLATIREAIRIERKLAISYRDRRGKDSRRIVWPVSVGFFETADMLAAWCESRADYRHFRLDRINSAIIPGERMPRRHRILLAEWRLSQNLEDMF